MLSETPQKPGLEALRQCLIRQETNGSRWPAAPLGMATLDSALPDLGLPSGTVQEVLPAGPRDFATTLGFGAGLLTRLARVRPGFVFWVVPRHEAFRQGALYPLGLMAFGVDPGRIIQVRVSHPRDVLWVLEETLGQASVSAVMGLLPGDATAYDFTASRRLALRTAESGVTALVLQNTPALGAATAADMRWRVAAAKSAGPQRRGQKKPALGPPRWHVELCKSKRGPTGHWQVEWDHETFSFRMAAPVAHRTSVRRGGKHSERGSAEAVA